MDQRTQIRDMTTTHHLGQWGSQVTIKKGGGSHGKDDTNRYALDWIGSISGICAMDSHRPIPYGRFANRTFRFLGFSVKPINDLFNDPRDALLQNNRKCLVVLWARISFLVSWVCLGFKKNLFRRAITVDTKLFVWDLVIQSPAFKADSLKTSQSGEGFKSSHLTPVSRSIAGQCSAGTFPLANQLDGAFGETPIFDAKAAMLPAISIAFLSAFIAPIILTFVSVCNTFVCNF